MGQHTDEEFDEMERALRNALARLEGLKVMEARLDQIERGFADLANFLDAMGDIAVADRIREALSEPRPLPRH